MYVNAASIPLVFLLPVQNSLEVGHFGEMPSTASLHFCEQCGAYFRKKTTLRLHRAEAHAGLPPQTVSKGLPASQIRRGSVTHLEATSMGPRICEIDPRTIYCQDENPDPEVIDLEEDDDNMEADHMSPGSSCDREDEVLDQDVSNASTEDDSSLSKCDDSDQSRDHLPEASEEADTAISDGECNDVTTDTIEFGTSNVVENGLSDDINVPSPESSPSGGEKENIRNGWNKPGDIINKNDKEGGYNSDKIPKETNRTYKNIEQIRRETDRNNLNSEKIRKSTSNSNTARKSTHPNQKATEKTHRSPTSSSNSKRYKSDISTKRDGTKGNARLDESSKSSSPDKDSEDDRLKDSEKSEGNGLIKKTKTLQQQVPPPKKYPCCVCDKEFSQQSYLNRHMMTHTGEKPLKCNHCNYSAASQHFLNQHLRSQHSIGTDGFKCQLCAKYFVSTSKLQEHVRTHVDTVTLYKCNFCKYTAQRKETVEAHETHMHVGVKVLHCDHCPRIFTSDGQMDLHLRTDHAKIIQQSKVQDKRKAPNSPDTAFPRKRKQKKPNGTVEKPNGTVEKPNGTVEKLNATVEICKVEKKVPPRTVSPGKVKCNVCRKTLTDPMHSARHYNMRHNLPKIVIRRINIRHE